MRGQRGLWSKIVEESKKIRAYLRAYYFLFSSDWAESQNILEYKNTQRKLYKLLELAREQIDDEKWLEKYEAFLEDCLGDMREMHSFG